MVNLRAEQLVEVLIGLESQKSDAGRAEKRGNARMGVRYRVGLRPLVPESGITGRVQSVWVRDISSNGIGLSLSQYIPEGEAFVIELPRLDGTTLDVLCMAMHCAEAAPGIYHVGSRFMEEWVEQERQRKPDRRAMAALAAPGARRSVVSGPTARVVVPAKPTGVGKDKVVELFTQTYAGSSAGMLMLGPDGVIRAANRACAGLFGLGGDGSLSGRPLAEFVSGEDAALDEEQWRQLFAGQIASYEVVKRFVRKDGATARLSVALSGCRDDRGRVAFAVACVRVAGQGQRVGPGAKASDEPATGVEAKVAPEAGPAAARRTGRVGEDADRIRRAILG